MESNESTKASKGKAARVASCEPDSHNRADRPKGAIMAKKTKTTKKTTKKATKKTSAKKAAKKAPAKKKASTETRGPTGRPTGKKTGLGIVACWAHLFGQNAKVGKAKRMTDTAISAFMKREYPGRTSKVFDQVQMVRNRFNKGMLGKVAAPASPSVPYDEQGSPVEVKPGRSATAGAAKAQADKVEAQLTTAAAKASLKTLKAKLAEIKQRKADNDVADGDDIRARVIRKAIKAKKN